jgi:hypothetical protein
MAVLYAASGKPVVRFIQIAGGVFVEDEAPPCHATRCFRFNEDGASEWAYYGDLVSINPAPRWFGHVFTAKDFSFA